MPRLQAMADHEPAGRVAPDAKGPHDSGDFFIIFDADSHSVRGALRMCLDYLAPLELSQDRLATIEIVLAETLNNITEHAYGDQGGPICMRARAAWGKLTVVIHDRGAPLPPGIVLAGGPDGIDPGALPEGGFGWHLIRSLATEVSHNRMARWNELKVVFMLA